MRLHHGFLLVLIVTSSASQGCEHSYFRRSITKPIAPTASLPYEEPAAPAPSVYPRGSAATAPSPLALASESSVVPPTADAVSGIIPPMPSRSGSAGLSTDSPIATAAGTEAGPLRDRLEEWRKRRAERRERRDDDDQEEPKPEKSEPKNTTPPPPAVPMSRPAPPLPPPATVPSDRPPLPSVPDTTTKPAIPVPPPAGTPTLPAPSPTPQTNDALALVNASLQHYATVPDFAARQIKREVVKGKPMPQSEMEYRFRQKPKSIYLKVLSEEGQGREILYVQNQHGNKIHFVTGKGDNRLVGAGFKTELSIDDRRITEKSRWSITDAGFGRTLNGLKDHIADVKSLGKVERKEHPYPLDGVEWTLQPGQEPQLTKGGKRFVFFDSRKESPSYLLPILVITMDHTGREVEYYSFDRFRAPLNSTDADWNPSILGKR